MDLEGPRSRIADATFYTVTEAFLAEFAGIDRVYAAESDLLLTGVGSGGAVQIDLDGDRLAGSVWLPELELHANFDAEWCEISASQFAMVEASPAYVCP